MKSDLPTVLARIKSGAAPRLLLLLGDELQVQAACRQVLDELIPMDQRGFNFERFDGRNASWEQIEASLMTPPLLPGNKLLWVENVPYFFSREQKGELGEKALELWREGKRDEAAKLLIDLLVLEGWTQDQWDALEPSSAQALLTLLDAGGGVTREQAEELLAYSKSRDLDLSKHKGSQGHRLAQLLDDGSPEWAFLLLTAVQVDRRMRLYKRFEEVGGVLYLGLERDRGGKISREGLLEFVTRELRRHGKGSEPAAREMILARAGDDLRGVQQELDKLVLFVGEQATIRAADVEMIFADHGEGWIFDLTRAIGERDAPAALAHLARLLAQGEPPLRLLATIAAELRRLLKVRQLLETDCARSWKKGMSYQQFQHSILPQVGALLSRNPYGDYLCFQRAESFSLADLHACMEKVFAADLRLKSSGSETHLVMEKLLLGMCLGGSRGNAQSRAPATLR